MKHTQAKLNHDAEKPIIDGDTMEMEDESGETFTLRLRDVDTRETYTERGRKDARWVEDWLWDGVNNWSEDDYPFRVFTLKDEWKTGEYGRRLGFIARRDNDDLLATSVIAERGNAVAWYDE